MFDTREIIREALLAQVALERRVRAELRRLRYYGKFRLESSCPEDTVYYYVHQRNGGERVTFRTDEEEEKMILNIRRQQYYTRLAKVVSCNIRLMRNFISKYRSTDPRDIEKSLTPAYHPIPEDCYMVHGENPESSADFLTQSEINRLVFEAAGPGSRNADAVTLGSKLQSLNRRERKTLAEKIGDQRLRNLMYPAHPEQLQHRAKDGTLVRSKSEVLEIDILISLHIPYRYEEPVFANGRWYKVDFAIQLPSTKRVVYLEHAGMIEKESYQEQLKSRVSDMIKEGFIPDYNLFFTFDKPGGKSDTLMLERKLKYILSTDV